MMTTKSPFELTQERKKTHGDWHTQSLCARQLKDTIMGYSSNLNESQREALDMIAVKISRILSGNPNHADHWDDIAGYALLGKQGHDMAAAETV